MLKKTANKLSYKDIKIGSIFEFERLIKQEDITKFAELTGDYNPLHVDKAYAQNTQFKGNIVPGMLAASFFSALIGMHCPGERSLYLIQNLNFRRPLRPDSKVIVQGEVIDKIDSIKMVIIRTKIICGRELIVDGEAKVKVI